MKVSRNPFTTLYVTERLDQAKFPTLFSPVLVPYIIPLFESGNVVIAGTQGTGKSMLLALLQTDIRFAYADETNNPYPVSDSDICQFICAGINLATNQALRSVDRWRRNEHDAESELRLCFIDYVNAWILRDLLLSIKKLTSNPRKLWEHYQLGGSYECRNEAFRELANQPFIHRLIRSKESPDSTIIALSDRIETYLKFFNGRPKELPPEILETQSQSLGQPVADSVRILRSHGCLATGTRVIIAIDQFEQLLELEASLPNRPYGLLRDTIDQALHRREPTLSFRIGTRPYAWQQPAGEALRDYHRLDLDDILRRREHTNKRLFPDFASDVFARRLRAYGYSDVGENEDPINFVFGSYPRPKQRVTHIGPKANWGKMLSIPSSIDEDVAERLRTIAQSDPLEGKLGVAWVLQQLADNKQTDLSGNVEFLPWNCSDKPWWKKERLWLAILQLASDNRQKIVMFGKKDVIDLSGGNILVFGSICQNIWECWLRDLARKQSVAVDATVPIDFRLQNDGILKASDDWHTKIAEERWIGDTLLAFLDEMGNWLRRKQIDDKTMSYPGGNGISLANRELSAFPEVKRLLSEATGRGFLLQRKHTPKNRSRGESTKWYLHPVLAPYYELTIHQTKEPLYVSGAEVQRWLERAGIAVPFATGLTQLNLPIPNDSQ